MSVNFTKPLGVENLVRISLNGAIVVLLPVSKTVKEPSPTENLMLSGSDYYKSTLSSPRAADARKAALNAVERDFRRDWGVVL